MYHPGCIDLYMNNAFLLNNTWTDRYELLHGNKQGKNKSFTMFLYKPFFPAFSLMLIF